MNYQYRWRELFESAQRKRMVMGFGENAAFRVADGAGDGLPFSMAVDSYAGRWMVSDELAEPRAALADALRDMGVEAWYKYLAPGADAAPVPLTGQPVPPPFQVEENGLRFEISFASGYSQGLFMDQRENRAEARRRLAPGMRLLNLFAYTCGFSVAGAAAGAETTSVDLSGAALDWGRRNFQYNDLDPAAHHFIKDDAYHSVAFFAKRGIRFDGIVLDPPTFSRSRQSGVWRVERDLVALVERAAGLLAEGGWMFVSSNCRKMSSARFGEMVEEGLARAGRHTNLRFPEMPSDFPGDSHLHQVWAG